ncbi:MAG: sulfatase/phosphatase domain-containing protein, partial [Woeseiaceae bacterium]
MDTEIGRLLKSIDSDELENTYVIFLGDNGTPGRMATAPYRRNQVKGTVYQGGINVPFFINGPGVDGSRVTKALANSVDLYATVLDLAGVAARDAGVDSVSLAPVLANNQQSVREFAYADVYGPQAGRIVNLRTIRNDRYKLLLDLQNDTREFYDLSNDPYENRNLLDDDLNRDAKSALDDLDARLQELVAGD